MTAWQHNVKIRHLLTEKEDWQSIQDSMNAIADVLEKDKWFRAFRPVIKEFRNIPKENNEFRFNPVDYANDLLDDFWNYCDENEIWVEL